MITRAGTQPLLVLDYCRKRNGHCGRHRGMAYRWAKRHYVNGVITWADLQRLGVELTAGRGE